MRLPTRLRTPSSLLALGAGVLALPLLMVVVLPRLGTASVAAASLPDPATDSAVAVAPGGRATAVLAGGLFLGHGGGVRARQGRHGGGDRLRRRQAATADYERVSNGDTGHAEGIRITYDPAQVSYGQLLKVFFAVAHDPTELNRQGPDVGTSTARRSSPPTPSSAGWPWPTSPS